MHRRQFIQAASASCLGLVLPSMARAQSQSRYRGPFFLALTANGGWDPTLTFDPKPGLNRLVAGKRLQQLAPTGPSFADIDFVEPLARPLPIVSMRAFIQRCSQRMVVLNGVDTATNNHEVGVQLLGCGKSAEILPAFSALVAANVAKTHQVPVAFMGGGGFEFTNGLVALSRLSPTSLRELAYPGRWTPGDATTPFLPASVEAQVSAARARSLNAQLQQVLSPVHASALRGLQDARVRSESLQLLAQAFEGGGAPPTADQYFPQLAGHGSRMSDLSAAMQQVELTLRAFQTGMAAAATVDFGNFDTHSNHDLEQQRHAGRMLLLIQYALERAESLGLNDQLYVAVTSELGRTPGYNDNGGKDHWNVTSALLIAPPARLRSAGRVVGATDDNHRPLALSTRGDAVALNTPGATRLKPGHLHRVLRREFGLTGSELDRRYALPPDIGELPLLG
jgi:hypothetical protein